MSQAICCVTTQDYLPGVIVLYDSILRHQTLPLYLLAADIAPDEKEDLKRRVCEFLPEAAHDRLTIVSADEVYGDAVRHMRFYYDAFEFATACKAGIHAWMLRNTDIERWLYLDGDMLCFGPLAPVFSALDDHGILLTPHRSRPGNTPMDDVQYLAAGTFNAGLQGIRRTPDARDFIDWYFNILSLLCLNDPPLPARDRLFQSTVLFTDQCWLDLVPGYFSGVRIAHDRGFNLGHWNVDQDRLRLENGDLHIGTDRIVLLHLSGWQAEQPNRLSRHSALDWSGDPVWARIHEQYRNALAPLKGHFDVAYRYDRYPDGSAIPKWHRRHYLKRLLAGGARAADPFALSAEIEASRVPLKRLLKRISKSLTKKRKLGN